MSIKKVNRKRTRRDYNFVDFTVRGFCFNWTDIKKLSRSLGKPRKDMAPQ